MNETQTTPVSSERDAITGRFLSGNSGGGRPKGSRNKLAEQFIHNLEADWKQHGAAVIEAVRRDDPAAYMAITARLLPAEVVVGTPDQFAACESIPELIAAVLGEYEDARAALAALDHLRAVLVERIASEEKLVEAG